MRPQDIIRKKRDGGELSREEIEFFVRGVTSGDVADYQSTALLMAILLKGMTDAEQSLLTQAMLHSGEILDFSDIPKPKADKHSTGGVGDKTSLLIAPLAAAAGICVPMISGRGLGHTGGTLDKLESIPGYRVNLSLKEFRAVLDKCGFAMNGQTAEIAPADRKLYALRDATATVEAIPLIVASIISKKGAAGLNAMVIDVKTGSGAFMREHDRARELAKALVKTGNSLGVQSQALITDMNQPLGEAVGNSVEVLECIELLRGEVRAGARPVLDLSIELAARMVMLVQLESSLDEARARIRRVYESGEALECFRRNVAAQGGDPRVCDEPRQILPLTDKTFKVESPRSGFVAAIDTEEIGNAIAEAGGGRVRVEDVINPKVGFVSAVKIGDELKPEALIGRVFCDDATHGQTAAARIQSAYSVSEDRPPELSLIKEVVE
ncbi:MAG TPA: thymidine phosphorylase [Pyrinomonadaceae bacterium]|jgi:pyrimidine-nucleoside phosphorylase/thymidine phosphorylase|nr:thymidine phosphorylase [Pyrinomonadaceae bacterium]